MHFCSPEKRVQRVRPKELLKSDCAMSGQENNAALPNDESVAAHAPRGEMDRRSHEFDWSTTPVGPIASWPQSLKTVVRIMLDSRYAMWLGWGPDFTFFYNDAYARMSLGPKHPWALGRSARDVWSEIWDDIGPRAESVVRTGRATWDERLLLILERNGFPEETYHTFSYSPVPNDFGTIGGMLCVVTEDTERTIGERRLRTLRELAARTTADVMSVEGACQTAVQILEQNPYDLPFTLLYQLDADKRRANLVGCSGLSSANSACPQMIDIDSAGRTLAPGPSGPHGTEPSRSRGWPRHLGLCPAARGPIRRAAPSCCRWRSLGRRSWQGLLLPGSAHDWLSTTPTRDLQSWWRVTLGRRSRMLVLMTKSDGGPNHWRSWTGPRQFSFRMSATNSARR